MQTEDFQAAVLAWFDREGRKNLPWQTEPTPYRVWVSEIMLQQTQVKTVIPYWERWMRELPTIQSVANVPSTRLHKLWEGLGYYTRVRNLQKAARQIIELHSGRFPTNFDDVLALPGIGRYTAGAICSIAVNQPTPILDGNVIRVLTRLFGITTNPRETKTNARLWQLADELVHHASRIRHYASPCSHLNQSLMELGALICVPRSPRCDACPVEKLCIARKKNWQEKLPNLDKRAPATARCFVAFVVECNGKFLVRQRPAGILNSHLWEFPNVEAPMDATPEKLAQKILGQTPTKLEPLTTIKHSITRYRITLESFRVCLTQDHIKPEGQWLSLPQLHKLAFTSAHKKLLSHLAAPSAASAKRIPRN